MLAKPSAFDPASESRAVWLFLSRAHRHDRLLGDAFAEFPDFSRYAKSQRDQILGQVSGCDNDGVVLVHRRGGDIGDRDYLWRNTLESRDVLTRFNSPTYW